MSTTKPSIDLPRALPHEDAPNYYALTDLTNLIIADTVWSHRKQARMSETKLADTMNKNRNFVRRVESGQYSITLAEFKSVAEALNLDHFEFAKEVLGEIDMASKAITAIAEPGIFLIEPHAQVDTQGDLKEDVQEDAQDNVKEDAQEDSKECAQVEAQGDLKEEVQDDTPEDAQECMRDDAEEDARDDARGCVQEDVEEDIEQECVQKSAKKPKRGTYRKTFRNRRKMPPKESKKDTKNDRGNAQENIAGTDPEGPAPVD